MKKILHTISAILLTGMAFAQSGVMIQHDGTGPNLAGSSLDINLYATHPDLVGGIYDAHFLVTNNTGSDKQWRITRKLISVPGTWVDQICWPPLCYNTSGDLYSTPNTAGSPAPTIVDGTAMTTNSEVAEMKPRITPDQSTGGFAHYRYYINEGGVYIDSVDLKINFVLATNEIKQTPQIAIGPNPASENVKISGLSADSYKLKIVDVLGNTIHQETIMTEARIINVGDYKNGVYFVILETPGEKAVTKRLIVRH